MDSLQWVDPCSGVVAVPEVQAPVVIMGPNPAGDVVQLNLSVPLKDAGDISVHDVHGRELLRRAWALDDVNVELDLAGFPAGLYIVELSSATLHWSAKLVKSGW
jgi:hypothetical protein